MNQEKLQMTINVNNQEIKLNPSIVSQFITKGNGKITDTEAVNFMQLCKHAELNPFLNEVYLIKFGSQPAQMVTSKEAFMKRANRQPQYNGYRAGIVVHRGESIIKKDGQSLYPGEVLIGGWAEVYRKDIEYPASVEVSIDEFNKKQSTWKDMPANMIRKVALVNALREAFPETLGAMYIEDEARNFNQNELKKKEFVENTEQLVASFEKFKHEERQADNETDILEAEFEEQSEPDWDAIEKEIEGNNA